MHPIRTIAVAYLTVGLTTSLPFHNANPVGDDKGIENTPDRPFEAHIVGPTQSNMDNVGRRLLEAKKLHAVDSPSKIKRENEDEPDLEPMNNIVKGPSSSRSMPLHGQPAEPAESPLEDGNDNPFGSLPRDTIEQFSIEFAYQTALEKTRQGYRRDVMIAYIREMLPMLSGAVAKAIVDDAVEAVVAEDILNWRDQKARLEQLTSSDLPSVLDEIPSNENERSAEMVYRMAFIKADEGMDSASLVKYLQHMFPLVDKLEIQDIVAKAIADIKTTQDDTSSGGDDPPWTDESSSQKRRRETNADDGLDGLEDLIPEQLALREEIVEYLQVTTQLNGYSNHSSDRA